MPKTKISEFDVDPANNTDINSINIAEGCAPSGINNAIRQLMSDLKEFQTGAGGDPVTVGGAFAANGGATLGDASGDALTINSSAVSIPNGLNFDSNTFVIDATNNNVGVNNSTPSQALDVTGNIKFGNTTAQPTFYLNNTSSGSWKSELLFQNSGTSKWAMGVDINANGNNNFYWYDAAAGAERMRIDSSGNVGIGTTTMGGKLNVKGSSANAVSSYLENSSNGTYSTLIAYGSNGDGVSGWANANLLESVSPNGGNLVLSSYSGGTVFQTGTGRAERMRIDSSGNLQIGTSADTGMLSIRSDSTTNSRRLFSVKTNGGSEVCVMFQSGVVYLPTVYGTTTGASANFVIAADGQLFRSTSSLKYKLDVNNATHGLAEVLQLRPVTYKGKSENDGDKVFGGLIAEEVHEAGLTEFVQYAEDGTPDALHYGNMVSLAFKAIQEQQAIITDLKARIETLENK